MTLICGVYPSAAAAPYGTVDVVLGSARSDGFSFLLSSLTQQFTDSSASKLLPRRDLSKLCAQEWSNSVVGVVSPERLADICSSSSEARSIAEGDIVKEVNWAVHMNIAAVLFEPNPDLFTCVESVGTIAAARQRREGLANIARVIHSSALSLSGSSTSIWISVPFSPSSSTAPLSSFEDIYRNLTTLMTQCESPLSLGINLVFPSSDDFFPPDVPAAYLLALVNRLIGLNVKAVPFPTTLFVSNKKGYPTLSKKMQCIVTTLMLRLGDKLRWVFTGDRAHFPAPLPGAQESSDGGTIHDSSVNVSGYLYYLQYLQHLRFRDNVAAILDTEDARTEVSYLDYLQQPLQPLADNLEFMTYETFEKDPVKYRNYEEAVFLAIRDGVRLKGWGTGSDSGAVVRLMVVGAGRGPMVNASLRALKRVNDELRTEKLDKGAKRRQVVAKIIALEKNPSAIVYLESQAAFDPAWAGVVSIVSSDMRSAVIPEEERADIVVSELLGSFGDNELSPECLDGAQSKGLMKADAVSIPENYVSFIAPLSSARLHAEAKAQAYAATSPSDGPMGQPFGFLRAMETPYVVRTHAATQTHAEKECFTFKHPNEWGGVKGGNNKYNERFVSNTFSSDRVYGTGFGSGYGPYDEVEGKEAIAAVEFVDEREISSGAGITIHGLCGTFDSLLYRSRTGKLGEAVVEESHVSIAPHSFSLAMFSWFPLFFPLRDPVHLPADCDLVVNIWRLTDEKKVWYEWGVEVYRKEDGSLISASPIHNVNGRSYFVGL